MSGDVVPVVVDAALAGEVQHRVDHTGPCQIRLADPETVAGLVSAAFPWRWKCAGPGHTGNGQHRTRDGRDRALAEHHRLVAAARARGELTTWAPVDK